MSKPLTREQVEHLIPLALDAVHEVDVGSGHTGVYSALTMMIDHDKAMRARIARLEMALKQLRDMLDCYPTSDYSPIHDECIEIAQQALAQEDL